MRTAMLVVSGVMFGSHLSAQDLEPRFLSPAPVGMTFGLLGYGYSVGNVVLDQALPLEGTEARVNSLTAAYARSIGIFGLAGRVTAAVPFATSTWSAEVSGVDSTTTRNGLGDPLVGFAVNFVGAPALRTEEYAAYRPRTIVGASLKVRVPLGQYDRTRFFNLSTNRWALSPRLGVAQHLGRFTLEGYVSAWFFTPNGDFFNGGTVAQAPMVSFQLHASYTFQPGFWGAASFGQSFGGATTVDGVDGDNPQSNRRLGAAVSIPLSTAHAVKLAFTSGITTRAGADFDTFVIAWQYRWGG